jgi:hypothetical protein
LPRWQGGRAAGSGARRRPRQGCCCRGRHRHPARGQEPEQGAWGVEQGKDSMPAFGRGAVAAPQRTGCTLMTHKYRGSQQSSREVLPKFIDSTQGEPKNICKP